MMQSREIRHGHGHDAHSRPFSEIEGSFAYHVRRYRQWYGKEGISQRALAMIARVSRHFVESLETSTDLQGSVEAVLRVALALRRPVEELVAPERLAALHEEIERRRKHLGGAAELPGDAPHATSPSFSLAVAYRSPHLIMALSDGKSVLEIRQHRSVKTFFRMRCLIAREATRYDVREIIVEADTKTSDYVYSLGMPYRTLALRRAKQYVAGTGDAPPPPDKRFFHLLVERHPELRRYVRVLPATGRVAVSERWRTARLTVAALALAASVASAPKPPMIVVGAPAATPKRRLGRRP